MAGEAVWPDPEKRTGATHQGHWHQRTGRRNKTPALLLHQQRNSCPYRPASRK